jgi:hypothetical protein
MTGPEDIVEQLTLGESPYYTDTVLCAAAPHDTLSWFRGGAEQE